MKKCIVNADDFGRHVSVNRAIIQGHTAGCITSASLMPSGLAFEDAIEKIARNPKLGIGIHFTLVGEAPVLPPKKIPSLVGPDGRFFKEYAQFWGRFLKGHISLAEVRAELTAQMEKVVARGITVTHIDSHQHLHVLPGVLDIALDIATRYQVKALRIPAVPLGFTGGYSYTFGQLIGRSGLVFLARLAKRKAKKRGFHTSDHFFGIVAGGSMREEWLLKIMQELPEGSSEIMVHPGDDDNALSAQCAWSHNFQEELTAVLSAKVPAVLKEQKIMLASFKDIIA